MGVSLFEKLCKKHPSHMTVFRKQYRMSNDILELSNSIIYHGVMTHGNSSVGNQQLEFKNNFKSGIPWLEEIKSRAVTMISTDSIVMKLSLQER